MTKFFFIQRRPEETETPRATRCLMATTAAAPEEDTEAPVLVLQGRQSRIAIPWPRRAEGFIKVKWEMPRIKSTEVDIVILITTIIILITLI